jgi:methionine synthase II (cobalamin-independent)
MDAPTAEQQIRTNALQEAVRYHVKHDSNVGVDDVVHTAERFAEFITTGT